MEKAMDIALYFLKKDNEKNVFNLKLINRNNRNFYEGNARLNKYLHLAQNIYVAKYGKKLFEEDFFAYDNGAVVKSVQESYKRLRANSKNLGINLSQEVEKYLDKIFIIYENATIDELIELSHEDREWSDKNCNRDNQIMNTLIRKEEYAKQYKDVITLLDLM